MIPDSVYRNQEARIGTIVQSGNGVAVLKDDKFNGLINISLHLHPDIAIMPAVGEKWLVSRRNGTDWFLEKKMDLPTESMPFSGLQPGDRRISTSGKVYLVADQIVISGTLVNSQFTTVNNTISTITNNVSSLNTTVSSLSASAEDGIYFGVTNDGSYFDVRTETTTGGTAGIFMEASGGDVSIISDAGNASLGASIQATITGADSILDLHSGRARLHANPLVAINSTLGSGTVSLGSTADTILVGTSNVSSKVGFYGNTGTTKAAAPTTLSDVITILRNLGLCG